MLPYSSVRCGAPHARTFSREAQIVAVGREPQDVTERRLRQVGYALGGSGGGHGGLGGEVAPVADILHGVGRFVRVCWLFLSPTPRFAWSAVQRGLNGPTQIHRTLDLDLDLDLGGARRGSSDGGTADDGHHGAVLVRPCAAFTQLCTVRL